MCVFSWASAWGGQGQPHTLFLSILIQDLLLGPGTHWLGRMSCHWTSKYCCPHLSSTGWQAYNIWVLMWVLKINWGPFACKVSTQPRYLLSYSMSSATSIISPNTLLGFCSYIWVVGIQLYEFCKFQGKIIWGKSSLTNFVHNGMKENVWRLPVLLPSGPVMPECAELSSKENLPPRSRKCVYWAYTVSIRGCGLRSHSSSGGICWELVPFFTLWQGIKEVLQILSISSFSLELKCYPHAWYDSTLYPCPPYK